MSSQIRQVIEDAWENREEVNYGTQGEVRDAVEQALDLLDSGEVLNVPNANRKP